MSFRTRPGMPQHRLAINNRQSQDSLTLVAFIHPTNRSPHRKVSNLSRARHCAYRPRDSSYCYCADVRERNSCPRDDGLLRRSDADGHVQQDNHLCNLSMSYQSSMRSLSAGLLPKSRHPSTNPAWVSALAIYHSSRTRTDVFQVGDSRTGDEKRVFYEQVTVVKVCSLPFPS